MLRPGEICFHPAGWRCFSGLALKGVGKIPPDDYCWAGIGDARLPFLFPMIFSRPLCLLLALCLSGCFEPYKKADAADRQPLKNMAGDTNFLAFVGRLRAAVRKKDLPMLSSMMTADFGYTEDASAEPGVQVFTYWDQNNLWPVLADLLSEQFAPMDLYMVSPPRFVTDQNYQGPRCGMRMEMGSWKFAYFLAAPTPQ